MLLLALLRTIGLLATAAAELKLFFGFGQARNFQAYRASLIGSRVFADPSLDFRRRPVRKDSVLLLRRRSPRRQTQKLHGLWRVPLQKRIVGGQSSSARGAKVCAVAQSVA
jgi:hypothetical protein